MKRSNRAVRDVYAPLRNLKFMDWFYWYESLDGDSSLRPILYDIMAAVAVTVDDWLTVESFYLGGRPKKAEAARKKAWSLAKGFNDWHLIWMNTPPLSPLFGVAFQKMLATARSFRQWRAANHAAMVSKRREDERTTIGRMMRLARTFEQWYEVWCATEKLGDEALRQTTRMQLDAVAKTPEQLMKIREQEQFLRDEPFLTEQLRIRLGVPRDQSRT